MNLTDFFLHAQDEVDDVRQMLPAFWADAGRKAGHPNTAQEF